MENEKKYSSEGRVLRPRKNFSRDGEKKSYSRDGERKSFSRNGEHKSYSHDGERRSFSRDGEHKSFNRDGERRTFSRDGEHRSYGRDGERRTYSRDGEHRSYGRDGERRTFSRDGERKSYGGRNEYRKSNRSYQKREPYFTDKDEEGIDRMISRKPQADSKSFSGEKNIQTSFQEVVRLNRFIANSGVCSRREADTFIQAGVVTVNGEVVTELGTKVNVLTDEIKFNGEKLKGEEKVYIVMNKPKGYVTTASDPHADKTVMELLKGCNARVFPVGRLDKATTGVLMFTNDGEIAEKLTHPSYNKKKIYQVSLDHELSQDDYNKILSGISLADGEIAADELEYIDSDDHRKLGIEIHSGKNRIVRRIFDSLGYDVRALDRVYFAGLTKKGLKKGEWRYLTEGEVNILKMGAYA